MCFVLLNILSNYALHAEEVFLHSQENENAQDEIICKTFFIEDNNIDRSSKTYGFLVVILEKNTLNFYYIYPLHG